MVNPEVEKIINEIPELRELLNTLPSDMHDKIWALKPDTLKKMLSGSFDEMLSTLVECGIPDNAETYDKYNEKKEETIFLCMRCATVNHKSVVKGAVKRKCGKCDQDVFMSPATCYSFARITKASITCEVCFEEKMKNDKSGSAPPSDSAQA